MSSKNIITNHHWKPIRSILDKIEQFCINNEYKRIGEIGPGQIPFSLATDFIGYCESIPNYINIDIDDTLLPFKDKEMDFIYCRHTMEDILNPVFAIKEMIRCCKSGYIETPSPLIEVTKGVDGNHNGIQNLYAGYFHHYFIIWSNIQKCEIYILPKINPIIDHFLLISNKDQYATLINDPTLWNNYFIWKDREPTVIIYKHFDKLGNKNGIENYLHFISRAINESIENTNYFLNTIR